MKTLNNWYLEENKLYGEIDGIQIESEFVSSVDGDKVMTKSNKIYKLGTINEKMTNPKNLEYKDIAKFFNKSFPSIPTDCIRES